MTARPVISVLMPVYNAERYVAEAVDSILAQTFTDFEFSIIDDGSTDSSLEILQRYARKDARIILRSRPNTGYVVTLNEMLATARGEFIARMDADDISLPHRFARQLAHLQSNPSCMCLGVTTLLVDQGGWPVRIGFHEYGRSNIDAAHVRWAGARICHPSIMVRSEVFSALGGYRNEFAPAEDLDFFLRVAEFGDIDNLSEILLHYRLHANSVSRTMTALQRKQAFLAVSDALRRRGCNGLPTCKLPDQTQSEPPSLDRELEQQITYAWWALEAGNRHTAAKLALKALFRNPRSASVWNLLWCVSRGW